MMWVMCGFGFRLECWMWFNPRAHLSLPHYTLCSLLTQAGRVSSVFFHFCLDVTTGLLWKQPDDSSINHSRSHDTGSYVNWPCHDAHTPSWQFSLVPSLFLPHFWGHLLSAIFIYGLCFWPWAVKLSMTATWLEDKTYGPMEFKCFVALRVKLRKQRKNNQINSDWLIKFKKNSPSGAP